MRIHLHHPLVVRRPSSDHIYAALALGAVLLTAYAAPRFSSSDSSWNQRMAPIAVQAPADAQWQKFSVAERAPDVLRALSIPELKFQNTQQLPIAKIDGEIFNGRLPSTLWVKLDQPGNAYLIAETDAGSFIKILQDASPGFVSPCKLSPYEFGSLSGEPIFFNRDELYVKNLWIVQDASAQAGRVPGWVRVPATN